MKAVVYRGPNKISIEELPIPAIESLEYLLNVKFCGLCKTDIKKIRGITLNTKGKLENPRVFGHEITVELADKRRDKTWEGENLQECKESLKIIINAC